MKNLDEELVCGAAFEDLSDTEMQDVEGGWTTVITPISLPCGVGASISTIAVSIY